MGTVLEISMVTPDGFSTNELRETFEDLFDLTTRLDALMTVYDADSDVSRLNANAGLGPLEVDPLVSELLSHSILYSRLTHGTFDVTVGPLVELWTAAAKSDELPSNEALTDARSRVGKGVVAVYGDGRVELLRKGSALNLGGIAKGFALDQMVSTLRHKGVASALLSFGQSSTWALGAPPGEPGWRLLVQGPGEPYLGIITLRDQALSVSGSLGQFAKIAGVEYGHMLDPRSGVPLTRRRQALVVAPNAGLAEALSKALLIGGEVEGLAIIESQPECEGLLADADGATWSTSGWQEAVFFRRAPEIPKE
jgi:thiamine biosynthesis lipoprotein